MDVQERDYWLDEPRRHYWINKLKRCYRGSIVAKALVLVSIVLVCVGLTFLLEDFVFLGGRFRHFEEIDPEDFEVSYTNIQQNPDGTLQATEAESTLTYNFDETYIYKIAFEGTNPKDEKIQYEIVCDEAYPIQNVDFYASFDNSAEFYVIDAVCSSIDINIMHSENIPFTLKIADLNYDFNRNKIRMFSTFVVLLVLAYTVMCVLGFFELKLDRVTAVYLLTIGLLLCLLIPPRYTYDDYAHLIKAQSTSYGIFHTNPKNRLRRPYGFDDLNEVDFRSLDDFNAYMRYYKRHLNDKDVVNRIHSPANSYTFVPYVFSALGLVFARLFQIPVYFYSFFARAGNLAFITVCLFFAMKIFPTNKLLMFYTAFFPIMMTIYASVGTGGTLVAALYLGIALVAYYRSKHSKEITIKGFVFMLALFSYVIFCRMPYGFLMMMLLLLPKEKFKDKRLAKCYKLITVIMMVSLMGFVYYYTQSISMNLVGNPGADMEDQWALITADPLKYIYRMVMYNIDTLFSLEFLSDASLIIFTGRLWTAFVLVEAILLILLVLAGNRYELVFSDRKSRWIMLIAFILSVGASEFAIYLTFSEVDALTITGFQARYIYSVLLVPLLTFQSEKFSLLFDRYKLEHFTVLYTWVMLALTVGNFIVKYYR